MWLDMSMDLFTYIQDSKRRRLLAKAAGTSPDYLYQIATDRRKPSPDLAKRIHRETLGLIRLEDLLPEVWGSDAQGKDAA